MREETEWEGTLCCYLNIAEGWWTVLKNEISQLCLNAPTATRESATPLQI